MYFRCKWGRRKITSLNWLERCKGLCDIDYYRAILEDDVTHERQPFYLNVFVYMFNFEKKNHNIQTTYHWVTGVEVYIIWYAFFCIIFIFYFSDLQQLRDLCALILLNIHLTCSYLDSDQTKYHLNCKYIYYDSACIWNVEKRG